MNRITFKRQSLLSLYGVALLLLVSSSMFILYPDLPFSIRNIIFFIMVSTLIFFLGFPLKTKYISIGLFIILMSINHFLYDPIQTPDSVGYHNIVIDFNTYGELLSQWLWERFNDAPYEGFVKFGILYYPLYDLFNFDDIYFIAVFNSILMVFSIYLIYKIGEYYFQTDLKSKEFFLASLVVCLFMSGNLYFYSTVFLKDITNLFACLIAVYALLEKRRFLFLLLLFFAIYTRIYSVAIIFFYYVFIKKDLKLAILGLAGCLLFVTYYTGPTGLVNVNISAASLLISPNPFNLENWSEFGLRTLESLFIGIGLLLTTLLFITNKKSRKLILIFALVIYSYACIMTGAGFTWYEQTGWDYQIGIVGDNVARKKLPITGIIYLMVIYSYVKCLEKVLKK